MGSLLHVELNQRVWQTIAVEEKLTELYVGGKGFGAKIVYDLLPPGVDPLAPDNVLIFISGPLTGTLAPAMRGCVVTKSPLTGTFVDSYFGGHFAPEIRYAGFDGIIITGAADKPCYIWIDNGVVQIRDGSHLWGLDTFTVTERLKAELGDSTVKTACIGPAGEKMVSYALINCEYNRHAGRGGTGAVMGSKNLKAIALRGRRPVRIYDPQAFQAAVDQAYRELKEEATIAAFTGDGTAGSIDFANHQHLLPTYNYARGAFDDASGLNAQTQRQELWLRDVACLGCPIACSKVGRIRRGRRKGLISDVVEYETAAMMGSNLGLGDVREVAYLVKKCDALGLDGISAGGVIGFAMEAFSKGIITIADTGGLKLAFSDSASAEYLLEIIAARKEGLGNLLAAGVKKAAETLGEGAADFAVHIKGLESPAWGPRSVPGMALALATADRGGCHQRAFPILYEVGGFWKGEPVERLGIKDKGEIVVFLQNYLAGLDTLVKCDFGQYGVKADTYSRMLSAATGRQWSVDELMLLGERVWNQVRLFNLREGFTRDDDTLPKRFMEEPLPGGPYQGHLITAPELNQLLDDYYSARGWSRSGMPTADKLAQLGINEQPPLLRFAACNS
jgi:aldehyde:ferredoxin oxidoreductase